MQEQGLMLLLKLENYLIASLKLSLNIKQWQKLNSDKWTPALKLKLLVLRGDCEPATSPDDKTISLENGSNCATIHNK